MTCFPTTPVEVFRLFEYQAGVPTPIILAMITAMIIVAIYVRTQSLIQLSILSIYSFAVYGSMWINDAFLEAQYHVAVYVVAVGIASGITMMILKLVKE